LYLDVEVYRDHCTSDNEWLISVPEMEDVLWRRHKTRIPNIGAEVFHRDWPVHMWVPQRTGVDDRGIYMMRMGY
jgi:hypothetical protein